MKHIPVSEVTAIDLDHYYKIYSFLTWKQQIQNIKQFQHLNMLDKLESYIKLKSNGAPK